MDISVRMRELPDIGLVWKVYRDNFRETNLGNALDVEDIIQEGYLKMIEASERFIDTGKVTRVSFLYKTLRFHLWNYICKNRNGIGLEQRTIKKNKVSVGTLSKTLSEKEKRYAEVLGYSDNYDEYINKEYIRLFMTELDQEERKILLLRLDGMKWVDIAKVLDCSRQMAQHKNKRIREKLIEYMKLS